VTVAPVRVLARGCTGGQGHVADRLGRGSAATRNRLRRRRACGQCESRHECRSEENLRGFESSCVHHPSPVGHVLANGTLVRARALFIAFGISMCPPPISFGSHLRVTVRSRQTTAVRACGHVRVKRLFQLSQRTYAADMARTPSFSALARGIRRVPHYCRAEPILHGAPFRLDDWHLLDPEVPRGGPACQARKSCVTCAGAVGEGSSAPEKQRTGHYVLTPLKKRQMSSKRMSESSAISGGSIR
jgi:hypothetical protein